MSSFAILAALCLAGGVYNVAATGNIRAHGFGQLFRGIHHANTLRVKISRHSPRNEVVSGLSTAETATPGWMTQYISNASDCSPFSQSVSYITNTCMTFVNHNGNTTDSDGVPYGSQYQYCTSTKAYSEYYQDSDCTILEDSSNANSSAPIDTCTMHNGDTDEAYGYLQVASGSFSIQCTDNLPSAGDGLFSNDYSTAGLFEDESCSFSTQVGQIVIVDNYCTVSYDEEGTENDESFLVNDTDEYYFEGSATCNAANLTRVVHNELDTCTSTFLKSNVTYSADDYYNDDGCYSDCSSSTSYVYYTASNPFIPSPTEKPTSHTPTASPSAAVVSSVAPSHTPVPSVTPSHIPISTVAPSTTLTPSFAPTHIPYSTLSPAIVYSLSPATVFSFTPYSVPASPTATPTISSKPTASPSASQNYYFNAEQLLSGIDYDTYMANYANNNFVLQSTLANGMSLPTLTTPSTTIDFPPGNIVIFNVVATSSASSSATLRSASSSAGSVAVMYAVNFNAAAMSGYTPETAYNALVSVLGSYSISTTATGFTSVLQTTAASYGTTVDLTSVTCYTFAYTPILYSGSTTSTGSSSSSSSNTGKINGLIAGLVIFAVLFAAAVGVAVFLYQGRGASSNATATATATPAKPAEPAIVMDNPLQSRTAKAGTRGVGDEQL